LHNSSNGNALQKQENDFVGVPALELGVNGGEGEVGLGVGLLEVDGELVFNFAAVLQ